MEQAKGHCKHGEFVLIEGCPQCIAERKAAEGGEAIETTEAEIAAFRDKVKTIPAGSIMVRPVPDDLFPDLGKTEERIRVEKQSPQKGPITLDVKATKAGFRRCDVEHIREYPGCFEDCPKDKCDGVPVEYKSETIDLEAAIQEAEQYPKALVPIEHKFGPPTSQALFKLYQEARSLLQFAQARVIASVADLKPATDDLAIILNCRKAMEARKKELVGPIREELDKFNAAFNELMSPILEADHVTRQKVSAFDTEQRRKAAEAKRIEDEKLRLAQEEAALNGTGEITVPLGSAKAAPPPELTRTGMGTLGGRANWKARVIDFKLLPDEYKLPNEQLLNTYARTHKGQGQIPGVEFYDERVVTVRTK